MRGTTIPGSVSATCSSAFTCKSVTPGGSAGLANFSTNSRPSAATRWKLRSRSPVSSLAVPSIPQCARATASASAAEMSSAGTTMEAKIGENVLIPGL